MFSWSFIRRFWERPSARAALATLPVLAVTALLFFESRRSERLLLETEISRQADNAFLQFQGFVAAHVNTLSHVRSYVQAFPEEDARDNFAPFVRRLLAGQTEFCSIVWKNPEGRVQRDVSDGGARTANVLLPETLAAAERKAAANGRPVATRGFDLSPGQTAVTVVLPLQIDGKGVGFVEGTILLTHGIQGLAGQDVSDFWNTEIYDRTGRCVYRAVTDALAAPGRVSPLAAIRHVPVADRAWELRIWPTPLLIASLHTGAPWRILGIGLVATLLLAFANYLLTEHQRRLATALRESTRLAATVEETRRHLSDLVNGIDAAIWESDAGGRHLTFVNDYARKLLGLKPEEWVSEPAFWLEHVHPDDRGQAAANLRAAQVPGETYAAEYRLLDAAGHHPSVREIITVIGFEGQVVGRRGVIVDITARVQAEEALRQSQKLESLGVLAGGIAHDFNNLLTTILGNTEMLKPFLEGQALAGREHLDRIERTTRRLADLTRQMLACSGRGRFSVERVDLNDTIREVAALLTVSTPKNVRVIYQLDPALPSLDGAPTQIRQVILNLLTNAAEAIGNEPDGRVLLRTTAQRLDAGTVAECYPEQRLAPGPYVRLEVSDNGCGMSEETMARIFDPFFTTKFTGRGLGLAALRGIVRGHHGGIRITSQPGEGTVFSLVFPVAEARATVAATLVDAPSDPMDLAHTTALVVDDEEGLRTLMVAALEEEGCTVYEASDGVEGLAQFEAHRDEIDVVVLDLTMPRLGGDEVFRRIRSVSPDTRVILCSGYTEEDIVRRFDGQGLSAFLEKPFKPSELLEKVAAALAGLPGSSAELAVPVKPRQTSGATHNFGRKTPAGKA